MILYFCKAHTFGIRIVIRRRIFLAAIFYARKNIMKFFWVFALFCAAVISAESIEGLLFLTSLKSLVFEEKCSMRGRSTIFRIALLMHTIVRQLTAEITP